MSPDSDSSSIGLRRLRQRALIKDDQSLLNPFELIIQDPDLGTEVMILYLLNCYRPHREQPWRTGQPIGPKTFRIKEIPQLEQILIDNTHVFFRDPTPAKAASLDNIEQLVRVAANNLHSYRLSSRIFEGSFLRKNIRAFYKNLADVFQKYLKKAKKSGDIKSLQGLIDKAFLVRNQQEAINFKAVEEPRSLRLETETPEQDNALNTSNSSENVLNPTFLDISVKDIVKESESDDVPHSRPKRRKMSHSLSPKRTLQPRKSSVVSSLEHPSMMSEVKESFERVALETSNDPRVSSSSSSIGNGVDSQKEGVHVTRSSRCSEPIPLLADMYEAQAAAIAKAPITHANKEDKASAVVDFTYAPKPHLNDDSRMSGTMQTGEALSSAATGKQPSTRKELDHASGDSKNCHDESNGRQIWKQVQEAGLCHGTVSVDPSDTLRTLHALIRVRLAARLAGPALKLCHDSLLTLYQEAKEGVAALPRDVETLKMIRERLAGIWCLYAHVLVEIGIIHEESLSTQDTVQPQDDDELSSEDWKDLAIVVLCTAVSCPLAGNHYSITVALTRLLTLRSLAGTKTTEKTWRAIRASVALCWDGIDRTHARIVYPRLSLYGPRQEELYVSACDHKVRVAPPFTNKSIIVEGLEEVWFDTIVALPSQIKVGQVPHVFVDKRSASTFCIELNRLSKLEQKVGNIVGLALSPAPDDSVGLPDSFVHFRALAFGDAEMSFDQQDSSLSMQMPMTPAYAAYTVSIQPAYSDVEHACKHCRTIFFTRDECSRHEMSCQIGRRRLGSRT